MIRHIVMFKIKDEFKDEIPQLVKNFYGMRIAQVGCRPKPFCSVICNESELMEKFDIRIIPINQAVVLDKYNRILEEKKEQLAAGADKLRQMYQLDAASDAAAEKSYAFVVLYQELFEEYKVSAMSAECWSAMRLLVGSN